MMQTWKPYSVIEETQTCDSAAVVSLDTKIEMRNELHVLFRRKEVKWLWIRDFMSLLWWHHRLWNYFRGSIIYSVC